MAMDRFPRKEPWRLRFFLSDVQGFLAPGCRKLHSLSPQCQIEFIKDGGTPNGT